MHTEASIDHDLMYSPELLGHECDSCRCIKLFREFRKDTSWSSGYSPRCLSCEGAPRLSLEEHVSRLESANFNSEAVKKQRHSDQEEFRQYEARVGTSMHCSDLLLKLHKLVPSLYVKQGGIEGDLALYLVAGEPQSKWDGKNYKYMGYVTFAMLPEYSLYEFDEKLDVMIRASERGWRDVLLRFIKDGLISEQTCDKVFGRPSSSGATVGWYKKLWNYRNLDQNQKIPENGNQSN